MSIDHLQMSMKLHLSKLGISQEGASISKKNFFIEFKKKSS
jgi:hypothetical protein